MKLGSINHIALTVSHLQREEHADVAEAIATQERQEKERLAAYLKSIGVDPDQIP